jgi:3-keto-5-aminohexanoate cleavage enzyme
MPDSTPLLIAVAPNGARKTRADHPALPLTPDELAATARSCLDAGAAMIHLHVRGAAQRHSLAPEHYVPAIAAIRRSVGTEMIIQVTSEAAGVYHRHQQMQAMQQLMPDAVSIALRELVPDASAKDDARQFFMRLHGAGSRIQFILYDPDEVTRYRQLCEEGVIPGTGHLLLFVLGRYSAELAVPADLSPFVALNAARNPWMCCAFGHHEQAIMRDAVRLGGHVRVGFENNLQRPDTTVASSNAELVDAIARIASACGRKIASATEATFVYPAS